MANTEEQHITAGERQLAFGDLAQLGKHHWGRYLGGTVLVIVTNFVLVAFVGILFALMGFGDALELVQEEINWVDLDPTDDRTALIAMVFLLLSIIVLLPILFFIVRLLHNRPFKSVLTARDRFSWKIAWIAGLSFVALDMAAIAIGLYLEPSSVEFIFDAARFWPFLVVVLLLVPFQSLAEEVLFRGYVMQGVGALTSKTMWRLLWPTLFFTLAHAANGDWAAGGYWAVFTYMTLGAYLGWLSLRWNGLEAAVGVHVANNLIAFLVISTSGGGMPFPTVLYSDEVDYSSGLAQVIVLIAIHYALLSWLLRKWDPAATDE